MKKKNTVKCIIPSNKRREYSKLILRFETEQINGRINRDKSMPFILLII